MTPVSLNADTRVALHSTIHRRRRALAGVGGRAHSQPMEQLVAQLARWLIYKLLLSLTKMLFAAAVRPKVGVTAHVCIQ